MTLQAALARIDIATPRVAELAAFYRTALCIDVVRSGSGAAVCCGPGRVIGLVQGRANELACSEFAFADGAALRAYAASLAQRSGASCFDAEAREPVLEVRDPEGRLIRFRAGAAARPAASLAPGEARLQHYAVRSPEPEHLVDFYERTLGFVVSDRVRDAKGALRAAFLRTDHEHHSLAIFHAPEVRFDHFSCETADWTALRDWADHMGRSELAMAWGVGRHGPGNDTFFMVADPDGNLAEISCDLERCDEDRAAGLWPHRPSTLNRWGMAIMRS